MARFGKLAVELSQGAEAEVSDASVTIRGPKGSLTRSLPRQVKVNKEDDKLFVTYKGENKLAKSLQGTIRSHLVNMVHGVTLGWTKELEIVGAGYRGEVKENDLVLSLGYSHPVVIKIPEGTKASIEKSIIKVEGIDKDVVGQVAATIRSKREPEPYKGSGIKYVGEQIIRKAGKQATTAG